MNWVNELEKAIELINAEEFDNCVAHVNTVLRDTTPGYPRIRYYALLALYFRLARGRSKLPPVKMPEKR